MNALHRQQTKPEFSTLEHRAERQATTYWRVRANATLDRLEREARRMFQLEQELGAFAARYYAMVGKAAERLAQLEKPVAYTAPAPAEIASALPAVIAQCDVEDTRRTELKTRYRSLAKEIHPDRAFGAEQSDANRAAMHTLNAAYHHGDLAALLRLEAQLLIAPMVDESATTGALEQALREIERAADTYAESYRAMLGSPLNELMLRSMSARLAGWDWVEAVVRKVERRIEEKERALASESIAQITAWREAQVAA